ncbi:MAG: radical SAM protein [Chloroflexi bacterium]|nr:radical SAM protein [Chloroflexota bacterium]
MLSAVHSDRSGRVFVSGDYLAAGYDGAGRVALTDTIPLPADARLVPFPRDAEGFDRGGRPRPLGRDRWALAAVLPAGHTRTHHPAYRDDPAASALEPLPYTALAAGPDGGLRVAATMTGRAAAGPVADIDALVRAGLRAHPSNKLVKQLARCARDYGCAGARQAFAGTGCAAITVASPPAERAPDVVAPRWTADELPSETSAFTPTAREIAELASAHLQAGGSCVSFGRACEGEPLASVRVIEDAVRAIRASFATARIHLETSGSAPAALRRLAHSGVSAVTIRLASARSETYELLHGPTAHRWGDVRASLQAASELGLELEIALLVLPGLTDRPSELETLVELLGTLPRATLALRDLAADPLRALALVPTREKPVGIAGAFARLRADVPTAVGARA